MASAFAKDPNQKPLFPTGNPPPPSFGNPTPSYVPTPPAPDTGNGWFTAPDGTSASGTTQPTHSMWGATITAPNVNNGAPDPGKASDYSYPTPPSPDYPLADPGYNEDWYKKYGQDLMGSPSASEDLYSKGAAGSNPFYDYAQSQTIKAINDASAARGDFNSSYTLRNIGNAVADLRGQQAHELGQLAGQADSAKLGRYNASEGFSADAQRAMEGRANAGLDRQMNISNNEANQVGGFYGKAGDEAQQAEMAKIETYLKQSGLSAEETKQAMDMFFGGMKSLAAFA